MSRGAEIDTKALIHYWESMLFNYGVFMDSVAKVMVTNTIAKLKEIGGK